MTSYDDPMHIKCVNCGEKRKPTFVKTFSTVVTPDIEELKVWKALKEWARLELFKLVKNDIINKEHGGEAVYCENCAKKLRWSVVK